MNIFQQTGAILHGHFVYTSGRHGEVYINKDAIYPFQHIHRLCDGLAKKINRPFLVDVDAVVAPALGGIVLSRLMADRITEFDWNDNTAVMAIYAEKNGDRFVIRRGYDRLIACRKVLVVDDIMTTGGSVKKVVEAVRLCRAEVCGAAVLVNRGGITAEDLGVPKLVSLQEWRFESWEENDCLLCKQGVPVNTDVGKGREFLTRQAVKDVTQAANMAVDSLFNRSVTSRSAIRTKEQLGVVINGLLQDDERKDKK
ncbi:MAG: phosphoribosyltransferase family protein [Patescibacteria group bacterium]